MHEFDAIQTFPNGGPKFPPLPTPPTPPIPPIPPTSSRVIDRQLTWAAIKGDEVLAKELLAQGARPQVLEETDALEGALANGHLQIARIFLQRGADPNKKTISRHSVLVSQVYGGNVEAAKLLLDHGADPNAPEDENANALHFMVAAPMSNRVEMATLLIEHGVNLEQRDKTGKTPLSSVAQNDDGRLFQALLIAGCDPTSRDVQHQTALHLAASSGCAAVLQVLIDHGVDLEARDVQNRTALHSAAATNCVSNVRALLLSGAKERTSARELAVKMDHSESVAFFDAQMALEKIDEMLSKRVHQSMVH